MRFTYSKEHLSFLQDRCRCMSTKDLTRAFNEAFELDKTLQQIRCTLKNHSIVCNRPGGRLLTKDQEAYVRREYKRQTIGELRKQLITKFGRRLTAQQLKTFVRNHKIKSGRSGQFERGHSAWNAGLHYTPGGRSKDTRFKPGQPPGNTLPVGIEVIDALGYRKRKVRNDAAPGESRFNWRFVHVLVWEEHRGPVPEGYVLAFKDGNRLNCDIDNLELLTRAEILHLNRNGYSELEPELREYMRAVARLDTTRSDLEKRLKEDRSAL